SSSGILGSDGSLTSSFMLVSPSEGTVMRPAPLPQRDGVLAEPFMALGRDQVIVLDADTAHAGDVKPRLQGDHVPGPEGLVGLTDNVRCLGVSQSQAVACVVGEMLRHAGAVKGVADRLVDRAALAPGPQLLLAGGHRLAAQLIQPLLV